MFNAHLLSLCDGQSYDNATILEDQDIIKRDLPRPFEDWTAYFIWHDKTICLHHYTIALIQLDQKRRWIEGCIEAERLILARNISYPEVLIIPRNLWADCDIPYYFIKRYGFEGQLAFTCQTGTIITVETNVSSLIFSTPPRGIIKTQPQIIKPQITPLSTKKVTRNEISKD